MKEYTSEFLHVHFDEAVGAVIARWGPYFIKGKPYREAHDKIVQIIEYHQAGKLIADAMDSKVITTEDQEYVQNVFVPQAIAAGIKKAAIVAPLDVYSKISIDEIVKIIPDPIEYKYFLTFEEAYQWIQQ